MNNVNMVLDRQTLHIVLCSLRKTLSDLGLLRGAFPKSDGNLSLALRNILSDLLQTNDDININSNRNKVKLSYDTITDVSAILEVHCIPAVNPTHITNLTYSSIITLFQFICKFSSTITFTNDRIIIQAINCDPSKDNADHNISLTTIYDRKHLQILDSNCLYVYKGNRYYTEHCDYILNLELSKLTKEQIKVYQEVIACMHYDVYINRRIGTYAYYKDICLDNTLSRKLGQLLFPEHFRNKLSMEGGGTPTVQDLKLIYDNIIDCIKRGRFAYTRALAVFYNFGLLSNQQLLTLLCYIFDQYVTDAKFEYYKKQLVSLGVSIHEFKTPSRYVICLVSTRFKLVPKSLICILINDCPRPKIKEYLVSLCETVAWE